MVCVMASQGVIYCATTSIAYLEAALISAIALRQHEPELPITLVYDLASIPLWLFHDRLQQHNITPRFVSTAHLSPPVFSSRWIKTRLNQFSPYAETLFLDSDILPLQPIADLWEALSENDFAMVLDRLPTIGECDHIADVEKNYTLARLPRSTRQFNSGVMLWRNTSNVKMLFQQWHLEWLRFEQQDQLALVRAIATAETRITELPRTYNISPIDAAALPPGEDQVHLLHYWGGTVSSGAFRRSAQIHYPQVVKTVVELLAAMHFNQEPIEDKSLIALRSSR
jgi:Glycosyl transferase family 8